MLKNILVILLACSFAVSTVCCDRQANTTIRGKKKLPEDPDRPNNGGNDDADDNDRPDHFDDQIAVGLDVEEENEAPANPPINQNVNAPQVIRGN